MNALENFLDQQGWKLVQALEKALPPKTDATGALRHSIHFTITRFGQGYTFRLYLEDYYKWVDKGRKPGKMPPFEKIWKWIADKRLEVNKNKLIVRTQGSKLKKLSDDLKLRNKITWAIMKNISKRGTKGTNFFSSTVPLWLNNLKVEIGKVFKSQMEIEVKEEIKKMKAINPIVIGKI